MLRWGCLKSTFIGGIGILACPILAKNDKQECLSHHVFFFLDTLRTKTWIISPLRGLTFEAYALVQTFRSPRGLRPTGASEKGAISFDGHVMVVPEGRNVCRTIDPPEFKLRGCEIKPL